MPVPVDEHFRLRLTPDAVSDADAERALVLWVNSPGNPAGALDDLAGAAAWGRERGALVASDECYAELTWHGPPGPSSGMAAGPTASTGCWPSIPCPSGATWPACVSGGTPATPRW